jgi:hypothetical protein
MSLLMDALKKAEKDKQARVEPERPDGAPGQHSHGDAPLKRESLVLPSSGAPSYGIEQGVSQTQVVEPSEAERPMEDLGGLVSPALEMDLSDRTEPILKGGFYRGSSNECGTGGARFRAAANGKALSL